MWVLASAGDVLEMLAFSWEVIRFMMNSATALRSSRLGASEVPVISEVLDVKLPVNPLVFDLRSC